MERSILAALASLAVAGCATPGSVDHAPYTPIVLELNQAPLRVMRWQLDRYRCPVPVKMTCSGATRSELWCQCSTYRPAPL